LARFPELTARLQRKGDDGEKSLFFMPASAVRGLPVKAILWPQITGKTETRLRPASAATLLLALAPSTIFQTPGAGEAEFKALGRLVQTVPTYVLEAGTDLPELARVITRLLK
jgi:hypothetical protein